MKKLMGMVAICGLAAGVLAGPLQKTDVGANAKWLVHLDLSGFRNTEVGSYVMSEMNNASNQAKFAALKAIINCDLRTDVDSVTLYGEGRQDEDGVAVFKGRFDTERLVTLLKANDTYVPVPKDGYVIHRWADKKGDRMETNFACALNPGLIVMGKTARHVGQALDVLAHKTGNLDSAWTFQGLEPATPTPVFAAMADMKSINSSKPNSQMLKQAEAASLMLNEVGGQVNGTVLLRADKPESAAQMNMVAQGLVAAMLLGAMGGEKPDPKAIAFVQGIKVQLQDRQLSIQMNMPAADLIEMMKNPKQSKIKLPPATGL